MPAQNVVQEGNTELVFSGLENQEIWRIVFTVCGNAPDLLKQVQRLVRVRLLIDAHGGGSQLLRLASGRQAEVEAFRGIPLKSITESELDT